MSAASTALLTYSAQLLAVVATAAAAAALVRLSLPSARFIYWRAVAVIGLALPIWATRVHAGPAATVTFGAASIESFQVASDTVLQRVGGALIALLPLAIAVGAASRVCWLLVGAYRLRRLRLRASAATLAPELESLRVEVAPRAVLLWTDALAQPATYGVRRPVVLLPRRFASLSCEAQRAVLYHELLHVARRDWPGILVEELVRSVFWFHPGMWWLVDRVQLAREQVVDQLVVARTASRRVYMDALLQFADAGTSSLPATTFIRRRQLASRLRQLSQESPMTRMRLVCSACALLIVLGGATRVVLQALPLDVSGLVAQATATRLEIRLAESQPGAGLVEAPVAGSTTKVYLQPQAVVTAADITAARVVDASAGRVSIAVTFGAAGSSRMAMATQGHIGRPVAILLDGRVISAPVLRSPIAESAMITGDFTRGEAEALAQNLRATPAAAGAPRPQAFTSKDPGVVLPVPTSESKAVYTQAAKDAKIQGDVALMAVVRADGTVGEVEVTRSLDTTYGLDDAAVESARRWTFKPGTKDGAPVDVAVQIEIRFTLK